MKHMESIVRKELFLALNCLFNIIKFSNIEKLKMIQLVNSYKIIVTDDDCFNKNDFSKTITIPKNSIGDNTYRYILYTYLGRILQKIDNSLDFAKKSKLFELFGNKDINWQNLSEFLYAVYSECFALIINFYLNGVNLKETKMLVIDSPYVSLFKINHVYGPVGMNFVYSMYAPEGHFNPLEEECMENFIEVCIKGNLVPDLIEKFSAKYLTDCTTLCEVFESFSEIAKLSNKKTIGEEYNEEIRKVSLCFAQYVNSPY